jgi:hypothetical protein
MKFCNLCEEPMIHNSYTATWVCDHCDEGCPHTSNCGYCQMVADWDNPTNGRTELTEGPFDEH